MALNIAHLKEFIVVENGVVNYEASGAKFQEALMAFDDMMQNDSVKIEAAVHALFDKYPSQNITKLTAMVMRDLPTTPDTYTDTQKRTEDWIKLNTGEYGTNKPFCVVKGLGGGHWRWSDVKPGDERIAKSKKRLAKALEAAKAGKPAPDDSDDSES